MTTQELLNAFRGLHGDTATPYIYSDATLLLYANEAQREACRRARLIVDSTTAAISVIAVSPGDQTITLDPRVIFIRDVRLASKDDPLWKIKYRDLDRLEPGWLTADAADVTHYCTDYQTGKVYFHHKFEAGDTVTMTVIREPAADMNLSGVQPEIQPRYQEKLTHWMAYRALNRSDLEDKFDPERAKVEYAQFEAEFGPPSKAIDEVWTHREHGYDQYEGTF